MALFISNLFLFVCASRQSVRLSCNRSYMAIGQGNCLNSLYDIHAGITFSTENAQQKYFLHINRDDIIH